MLRAIIRAPSEVGRTGFDVSQDFQQLLFSASTCGEAGSLVGEDSSCEDKSCKEVVRWHCFDARGDLRGLWWWCQQREDRWNGREKKLRFLRPPCSVNDCLGNLWWSQQEHGWKGPDWKQGVPSPLPSLPLAANTPYTPLIPLRKPWECRKIRFVLEFCRRKKTVQCFRFSKSGILKYKHPILRCTCVGPHDSLLATRNQSDARVDRLKDSQHVRCKNRIIPWDDNDKRFWEEVQVSQNFSGVSFFCNLFKKLSRHTATPLWMYQKANHAQTERQIIRIYCLAGVVSWWAFSYTHCITQRLLTDTIQNAAK